VPPLSASGSSSGSADYFRSTRCHSSSMVCPSLSLPVWPTGRPGVKGFPSQRLFPALICKTSVYFFSNSSSSFLKSARSRSGSRSLSFFTWAASLYPLATASRSMASAWSA
jgi:hypothetical protein